MKRKGAKITESAPIAEGDFIPGRVLQNLNIPDPTDAKFLDPKFLDDGSITNLPEPLLRRVRQGPVVGG